MVISTGVKTSFFTAFISLVAIVLLLSFTSPINTVAYAGLFFIALFVLLASLGHLLTHFIAGHVSLKSRNQIFIICGLLVLVLMFQSIQSLNWVEALIMVVMALGLLFYNSRRF